MDENQEVHGAQSENLVLKQDETESRGNKSSDAIVNPHCFGLEELSGTIGKRACVSKMIHIRNQRSINPQSSTLIDSPPEDPDEDLYYDSPLFIHLAHGLAYTVGSALGTTPPSPETCLAAYLVPNSVGLTAGSRAWSKHSHRSQPPTSDGTETDKRKRSAGWWGTASGPQSVINEKSLSLFHKVVDNATWRNLHWLPHQVLVYEVRVSEGYGMRWSQDQGDSDGGVNDNHITVKEDRPWTFRGFLEPTMENGHELKWRHPVS